MYVWANTVLICCWLSTCALWAFLWSSSYRKGFACAVMGYDGLWWAGWPTVSAVRAVLFIELELICRWGDEKTLKLEDQVLSRAYPAGWQNWDGWSIVSTAFGALQLWENSVFWAFPPHMMFMRLWQSHKGPVIRRTAQAAWGALKSKPCCKIFCWAGENSSRFGQVMA